MVVSEFSTDSMQRQIDEINAEENAQDVALDTNSTEIVTHSFTMCYSRYELLDE